MHYTPGHCLVNGGVPLFWWKEPCFNWLQHVSFLRSPAVSTGLKEASSCATSKGKGVIIEQVSLHVRPTYKLALNATDTYPAFGCNLFQGLAGILGCAQKSQDLEMKDAKA